MAHLMVGFRPHWIIYGNLAFEIIGLVGGIPTPLKKNMKVSWDYELPNMMKVKTMFQTTNQRGLEAFMRIKIYRKPLLLVVITMLFL